VSKLRLPRGAAAIVAAAGLLLLAVLLLASSPRSTAGADVIRNTGREAGRPARQPARPTERPVHGFVENGVNAFPGSPASQDQRKLGPFSIATQGVLYLGGTYDNPDSPTTMAGQMHVFYQLPNVPTRRKKQRRYPIVMIHGSQQTGANFLGTPDGRPGWALYFASHGWPVYVIDQPGRGKSGYFPDAYGAQGPNPNPTTVQRMFTAPELSSPLQWPQAALHTQWPGGPGSGVPGQYAYDQFFSSQVANMPDTLRAYSLTTRAVAELLEQIGPAIIMTHSMTGPLSWLIPQAAPGKVKAIVALEPSGNSSLNGDVAPAQACGLTPDGLCLDFTPPVSSGADLNLTRVPPPDAVHRSCWLQGGAVHTLPWLDGTPIVIITGEASYHATYDYCTPDFLDQAGVTNEFVYLPTVGIHGNGHMLMLERNNLEIAEFLRDWLEGEVRK
jgi:pimeloyl-ACP methyl ester carboxylesterase